MPKTRSSFVCQQCGYSQVGWAGKCPNCDSWGSLVETVIEASSVRKKSGVGGKKTQPLSLPSIEVKKTSRTTTKISELDRVLGGGLVTGQVVLLAGEPGIGKSTILLQLASNLSDAKSIVLYVSGEESAQQVAIRAQRLGIKNKFLKFFEETNTDVVVESIDELISSGQPLSAIIIDSIQTMATIELSGMAGSVGQVRESAFRLVRLAKERNVPVFIVGHVTKQGSVAGPAVLMHMVDKVLWFEGDKSLTLRLLRAVKNRFGPTDEVGIFTMEDKGLVSLDAPEKIFLTSEKKSVPGSVTTSILEGTRPLLVEIQSLVVPSRLPFPKRIAQGMDPRRLELMLAVLIRRAGLPLYEYDCFVNITGGITLKKDPSADFATCLSIASSFFDKPVARKAVVIGEVGLLGDIREVTAQDKRVREARRLGYTVAITNKEVRYLQEAIKKYLK